MDFPKRDDAETEHLVGDIFDFWKVRRGPIWTQSHNDVIQKLLRKSRKGSRIVYIPGNHDEAFREYCGLNFGSIELRRDAIFEMDQPPPQLGPPQVAARLRSLSNYLKSRVKTAVNFIGEFETALSEVERRQDAYGMICSHIHHAADRLLDGIHYLNCGDWVESAKTSVETHCGKLKVLGHRHDQPLCGISQ